MIGGKALLLGHQAAWPDCAKVCPSCLRRLVRFVQIRAAAELWDGTGTLLFTGSAGLFTVDDGSQCNEDSPVAPLGVSERNDRCKVSAPQFVFRTLTGSVHGGRAAALRRRQTYPATQADAPWVNT